MAARTPCGHSVETVSRGCRDSVETVSRECRDTTTHTSTKTRQLQREKGETEGEGGGGKFLPQRGQGAALIDGSAPWPVALPVHDVSSAKNLPRGDPKTGSTSWGQ